MKKTIKLVATKINGMKVKELWAVRSDPMLSELWFSSQKPILTLLTAGGISVILLWQLYEIFYLEMYVAQLSWLRWTAIATFCLNLFTGLARNSIRALKQHLIAGFYLGTGFCLLLVLNTGGSQSPYWFGLFFIIVAWFTLVPFSFREMILHSMAFVLIFTAGQYAAPGFMAIEQEMTKIVFLYSVTLVISFFSTYIRKNLDNLNLQIKKELENKNHQLLAVNNQLTAEINNHNLTTQRLMENQQFLDNILSNAPIVIWSIDLKGYFTYSQYKGKGSARHENRVGNSALEIYKDTEVEAFLRKVLNEEVQSEIIEVDGVIYDTRVTPVYNGKGEKTGYMGVSLDVTKRIKTERELRKEVRLNERMVNFSL